MRKNAYKFAKPIAYPNNPNIFSQAIVEEDESDYDVSRTSFLVLHNFTKFN